MADLPAPANSHSRPDAKVQTRHGTAPIYGNWTVFLVVTVGTVGGIGILLGVAASVICGLYVALSALLGLFGVGI